ncbi:MAG TPA: hypothetical protein VF730_14135, partial [Terracidiphilus sp.]
MAVKDLEAIGLSEQRAELTAVLASSSFSRAPTLAHLLSYLCEKLFSGQTAQIKEYSIGIEVFHRGPEFDQDTDSIVRVEANRLRRRLAEYYQAEGAQDRLRITIPLGQYVPRFDCAVAEGKGTPAEPVFDRGRFKRWFSRISPAPHRVWWSAIVAVVLLFAASYVWLHLRERKQARALEQQVLSAPPRSEVPFGPPGGQEVRILAGSNRSFVDHAGRLWGADAAFTGGVAVKSPT